MNKHNKEKHFQGMEHLIPEGQEKTPQTNQEDSANVGHRTLKKELVLVLSLMAFFFLVLIGLMFYDNGSTVLSDFAQKIADTFTK